MLQADVHPSRIRYIRYIRHPPSVRVCRCLNRKKLPMLFGALLSATVLFVPQRSLNPLLKSPRSSTLQCKEASPPPPPRAVPTALALGPLFLAQCVGEQYFVPTYLPLLMFVAASEGRTDGLPAASALAIATLIYAVGSALTDTQPGSVLLAANIAACVLLVVDSLRKPEPSAPGAASESLSYDEAINQIARKAEQGLDNSRLSDERMNDEASRLALRMPAQQQQQQQQQSEDLTRRPADEWSRGDFVLALALTLVLILFLTATLNPVAGLRSF